MAKPLPQKALALLIVMFIVALASMLVVSLTYSTYLGARINATAERSVQAEYLLKSALNYAMVLIKEDIEPGDSAKDIWGKYSRGIPLQRQELVENTLPDIPVSLEIRPEGAKLNIRRLAPSGTTGLPDADTKGILERLFKNLGVGFEFDKEEFIAPDGQNFQFTSQNLIANLVDFMDKDELPYDDGAFKGIEGENSHFPNREITRIGELSAIPGFTASRVRKLLPFLTTVDNRSINVNLAPRVMLLSLDDAMTDTEAGAIMSYRDSDLGPIKDLAELGRIIPSVIGKIQTRVSYESTRFQVIAKVEYSTSVFFLRADLAKDQRKTLPRLKSIELF